MNFSSCVARLHNAFEKNLPGHEAHLLMSPAHRLATPVYLEQNPSYKTSCVMLLLYPAKDEQTHLIMIERAEGNSTHSGQISFPGGRREMDDATLLDVALRETYEEIGVDPSTIKSLGQLTELYIPVSNFLVHPFVGIIDRLPGFIPSPSEVKKILTPPLHLFLKLEKPLTHHFKSYDGRTIHAPYYSFEEYKIWGASAMMINELCALLK